MLKQIQSWMCRQSVTPIAFALLWRYACYALMVGLTLINEAYPAPHLNDRLLDAIPYVPWVAHHNFRLWVICYGGVALWLWRRDGPAFLHFLYVGGLLSLARGICIWVTDFGPVDGPDVNAGLSSAVQWQAWLVIMNPFSALSTDTASIYLTKDLFFSGHTASTFLLWLYCRPHRLLGKIALIAHILVVVVVFTAHLHYTVDVIGAWAITFGLYTVTVHRWPVESTFGGPRRSSDG